SHGPECAPAWTPLHSTHCRVVTWSEEINNEPDVQSWRSRSLEFRSGVCQRNDHQDAYPRHTVQGASAPCQHGCATVRDQERQDRSHCHAQGLGAAQDRLSHGRLTGDTTMRMTAPAIWTTGANRAARRWHGPAPASALQEGQLVGDAVPVLGVTWRWNLRCDHRPQG